jgi:hypothetical protein
MVVRIWTKVVVLSLVVMTPVSAGKNANGALVVHTDDMHYYVRS